MTACAAPTAPPTDTRRTLAEVGPLAVHRVRGPRDSWHDVWKRSVAAHHYLGVGPLCGAQLRYVVCAGEQVVAAVSFSACALHLAAREGFIGWSRAGCRAHRQRVIAQSRFCLTVRVPNLASRVQALLLARVAEDWDEVYGLRPVLVETYVDATRFRGTCYRASNWQCIGKTQGRGRQDRRHQQAAGVKTVWVYPLDPRWQEILSVEPVLAPAQDTDWAENEWGAVAFRDRRLTRRLVRLGRARFARPTANLPQACGSPAELKAAYRLLNHPLASLDSFLSAHSEATLSRAMSEPVVLAIQDTTSLNYTTHHATEGLGPISSHGANGPMGLEVHSLFATTTAGIPLGLLNIQAWARDPAEYGKTKERRNRPTEDKESQKWLRGYAVADQAARRLDRSQVVVVADREADMFELFEAGVGGCAQLLVRAVHPRRVLTSEDQVEGLLWDLVGQQPVAGTMQVCVPGRDPRPPRIATLELRFREARVGSPRGRGPRRSVRVWAVAASESAESAGTAEPIEWLLLTTLAVASAEAAIEKVKWYTKRWQIEVWHKTLKSGCKVERKQLANASSLEAALAIDAVVAWRVMALVKMGREVPDMPCTAFFEELEWQALCCFVNKTKTPPAEPPSLRDAMRMVARLGGFLGRKSDGEPGEQNVWRGVERLSDISVAFALFFSSG